jgi:hypothetical protein
MEDILDLYESEYDPKNPVVCVDEKPYQLLSHTNEPIPINPEMAGKTDENGIKILNVRKEDYEYEREGTCNIFMLTEPFADFRATKNTEKRTKKDFAQLLKDISDIHYPEAEKIRLVADNLNTHNLKVLYEVYSPEEARRITRRFEIHYTPKHGSWLNIAEIELSAMARQCTDRRIPDMETLRKELEAWSKERNAKKIGVNWRFKTEDARIRLKKLYPTELI